MHLKHNYKNNPKSFEFNTSHEHKRDMKGNGSRKGDLGLQETEKSTQPSSDKASTWKNHLLSSFNKQDFIC